MILLSIVPSLFKTMVMTTLLKYRICGIIGESKIWQKIQLVTFLCDLSAVWKETHAYSLKSVHLIWRYLRDSPNCQIKVTTKYTMYTVRKLFAVS